MSRPLAFGIFVIGLAASVCALAPVRAQQPESLEELSKTLKPLLTEAIPQVLYEKEDNWGHTSMGHRVTFHGLRPEFEKAPRNDGTWKKMKISLRNPKQTLDIRMYGLKSIDEEKQVFKTDISFMCTVDYDQQNWENGWRLWSGGVRARFRVKAKMDCENTIRVETKEKSPLPDVVFRLRVTQAKVDYDQLVVEHIAGMGGTAAKIIGETFHDALHQWKPSVERKLLERASSAVVKAADTKEIRIGLSGLFKEKK